MGRWGYQLLLASILVVSAGALGWAVYKEEIGAIYIAPIFLFEVAFLVFLFLFLEDTLGSPYLALESRWGGLGGGLGGWRIPRSIVYLGCAFVFGALFVAAAEKAVQHAGSGVVEEQENGAKNGGASGAAGDKQLSPAKGAELKKGADDKKDAAPGKPDTAKQKSAGMK